jgi:hypothetical protein
MANPLALKKNPLALKKDPLAFKKRSFKTGLTTN